MQGSISRTTPSPVRADQHLGDIGWGLLLVLTGLVWVVPAEAVPAGAWLFGVAAILLGLNAFRYATGVALNIFSMVLGLVALIGGLGQSLGSDLPLLAICLILIGSSLVLKPLLSTAR